MGSKKIKIYSKKAFNKDQKELESLEERLKRNAPVNEAYGGLFQTDVVAPDVFYNKSSDEVVHPDYISRAQIVFGTDRPDTKSSGWGGKGSLAAAKIDLVVGRMAGMRNAKILSDQDPNTSGTQVNNSFSADAARIYISQMANIDEYFGLADGVMNPKVSVGKSGIGIKADGVRIIGREGVKIVSGPAQGVKNFGEGETNSLGGKISKGPPIELIAGNQSGARPPVWGGLHNPKEEIPYLQSVPLGKNTRDALYELQGIIGEILAATTSFVLTQRRTNFLMATGIASAAMPVPVAVPAVAAIIPMISKQQLTLGLRTKGPLWHTRINQTLWRINYLEPYGYKYICSRDVFTT